MGITHLSGLEVAGIPTMGTGGLLPFTGNWWFVDPLNGSDGNTGAADNPFATLGQAQLKAVANNNDVVCLVSNASAALTSTLNWAKDKVHLIGIGAPTEIAGRARISSSGSTVFSPLVNVTAQGCMFLNLSTFYGFDNASTQICWAEAGQRNYYENVDFQGMGNATASAQSGSRDITIGAAGQGENTFVRCTFGLDTVARTAANANLEFLAGTPRNVFRSCRFIGLYTGTGASGGAMIKAAAGSIDRWQEFDNCTFIADTQSGGTALSQAVAITGAPGGLILLNNPTAAGVTAFETASSGKMYINGTSPTFATAGLSKNS